MSYRPLPSYLTIKESNIEGLGLFAVREISDGTILGVTHIKCEGWVADEGWIRTPLGGFYNHSDEPNCESFEMDGRKFLRVLRDIEAGEEITSSYKMYSVDS